MILLPGSGSGLDPDLSNFLASDTINSDSDEYDFTSPAAPREIGEDYSKSKNIAEDKNDFVTSRVLLRLFSALNSEVNLGRGGLIA